MSLLATDRRKNYFTRDSTVETLLFHGSFLTTKGNERKKPENCSETRNKNKLKVKEVPYQKLRGTFNNI